MYTRIHQVAMTHSESLDFRNVSGNVMDMGYTKLFSSLVMSSVWREPDHVRIVWITMLALKDERGEVRGSIGGLSDAARVTREHFEDAVRVLESPDPDSSNPDNEGRRIERITGGWFVLNHSHYNRLMSAEDIRAKNAERQRRFRQSRQALRDVTEVTNVTEVTPSDQIIPEQIKDPPKPPRGGKRKRAVAQETQMPADWAPTDKHRAYATEHGLDLQLEVDAYRGWAEGRTTPSWNGTFTTRLANAVKWRSKPGQQQTPKRRERTVEEAMRDFK
jgi:hypothetical protein